MTRYHRNRMITLLLPAAMIVVPICLTTAEQPSAEQGRTGIARPHLGVRAVSAGQPAARQSGIEATTGAVVLATDVAGPADVAGLARGDLIVEFGGRTIRTVADLAQAIAGSPIGSEQTIVLIRKSELVTRRVVIGEEIQGGTAAPSSTPESTNQPPNTSPIGPPLAAEPQPPAGWVRQEVGRLVVYLPPDWTPIPFLASDEGCWFHGSEQAKRAVVAIIRDLPCEELLKPMNVESRTKTTLAGRTAWAYAGPTTEQAMRGYGVVVFPERPESDGSLLALLCFSAGNHRAEYEATFKAILQLVRNRPAGP